MRSTALQYALEFS